MSRHLQALTLSAPAPALGFNSTAIAAGRSDRTFAGYEELQSSSESFEPTASEN